MLETRLFAPPDQFVGDSEKKKEQWQKDNVNFFESLILFENRQLKTSYYNRVTNYNLKRGILNMADVEKIVDPLQLGMGTFPGKLDHKGVGNAKIDLLVGEHIKRKFDFRVMRSSSDQQGIKEVEQAKTEKIHQELLELIQQEGLDEAKIQEKVKALNDFVKSPYFDIAERGSNKILKYTYKKHNIKEIFDSCFEDALICGEQYIFTEYIGDELIIRRGDPLRIFSLMNAYSNTEDGLEALVEISYHTLSSLIDMFHNKLTKEQLNSLREMRGVAGSYPYFTYPQIGNIGELAIPTDSITAQTQKMVPMNDVEISLFSSYFDSRGNIRLMTTYWRSKRKIKILKYLDEYGVEQTKPVHEKYKEDKVAGEEIVKEEWVNEWWKGYKIGSEIVIGVEPVPFLSVSIDNFSKQTCPVSIQYYNTGSSKVQSLMDIVKPYDYLYDIFDYKRQILINLMLPDIVSFNTTMIPDNMTLHEYLNYIMSTAFMPQDPTAEILTPKGAQAAGVFNTVTSQRLQSTQQGPIAVLTQVMENVKMTMDTVSGITPQRQGAITSEDLVGTTQRSITQSSHSTERWFAKNEYFKERVLKKVLDIQLNILRKKPRLLNYLLDDFTKSVITNEEIDAIMMSDFDVMVSRSTDDARLLEIAEQMFQAAMQNGSARISDLIDVYKNESIGDALRILRIREDERAAEQQQVQQQQIQQQQQAAQMMAGLEQQKLELEYKRLEMDKYKIDNDYQRAIDVATINAMGFAEDKDVDQNNVPDVLETQKLFQKDREIEAKRADKQLELQTKSQLEKEKMSSQERLKKEELKVARENMKNDKEIALINARNRAKAKK